MPINVQEIFDLFNSHPATYQIEYPLYCQNHSKNPSTDLAVYYWTSIWLIVLDILVQNGFIAESGSLPQLSQSYFLVEACTDAIFDLRKERMGFIDSTISKEDFSFETVTQKCIYSIDRETVREQMDYIQKSIENTLSDDYLNHPEMLLYPSITFNPIRFHKILTSTLAMMEDEGFLTIEGVAPWSALTAAYEITRRIYNKIHGHA